jgi:hypothetical protein
VAGADFGTFSTDVLVGNFGDGRINAFDPVTGAFLGQLRDESGNAITIMACGDWRSGMEVWPGTRTPSSSLPGLTMRHMASSAPSRRNSVLARNLSKPVGRRKMVWNGGKRPVVALGRA